MSREKSLMKNTIILAIGTFLPRIINLATTPIITSTISTEAVGYIDVVTTIILALIVPIGTLQLEQALFRFLIDAKTDDERRRVITTGYSLIALIMIIIGLVCLFVPVTGFTGIYKLLLIGYIWIEIMSQMSRFVLRAFSMYKEYSVFAAIAVIVNFVSIFICLVVLKTGYMGVIISLALADIVGMLYVLFTSNIFKYFNLKYLNYELGKDMLRFSIPFVPNMVSWFINQLSDRWLIAIFLGNAANGVYMMANKIPSIVNILYPAFNMAWTESASRSISDDDTEKYYSKMFKMLFYVISAGTACLTAISPFLFVILCRNVNLNVALYYTPTLIIATYFYCFAQFFSSIYIAVKSGKSMSITTTVAAVINVVINLLFLNLIGVQAAVISTFVANLSLAGYRYYDINKNYYKLKVNKRIVILTGIILLINSLLSLSGNNILMVLNLVIAGSYAYFIAGDIVGGMVKSVINKKSN